MSVALLLLLLPVLFCLFVFRCVHFCQVSVRWPPKSVPFHIQMPLTGLNEMRLDVGCAVVHAQGLLHECLKLVNTVQAISANNPIMITACQRNYDRQKRKKRKWGGTEQL